MFKSSKMNLKKTLFLVVCIVGLFFLNYISCEYTQFELKNLENPFRMKKINLVWTKARLRLSGTKLESLYSTLKIHDKEELTLKTLKGNGGDKDGLKEAELRKKLSNTLTMYGLAEHFGDHARHKEHAAFNLATEDHINKSMFKDKKLNYLWLKAESAGFTVEELSALKEEFQHHQEKIDEYYNLLGNLEAASEPTPFKNALNDEEMDQFNEIMSEQLEDSNPNKQFVHTNNLVKLQHSRVRDGYDELHKTVHRGPERQGFLEPKVISLWEAAKAGNFTTEELASLQAELEHYETRLIQLRTINYDHIKAIDKHGDKLAMAGDKSDIFEQQKQTIKKHMRKVEKMQADLESKILGQHNEL